MTRNQLLISLMIIPVIIWMLIVPNYISNHGLNLMELIRTIACALTAFGGGFYLGAKI